MVTFARFMEKAVADSHEASHIGREVHAFARKGFAWVFGDRLESSGFFQHSFASDFSVYIGEKLVEVFLRFDPLACPPLLEVDDSSGRGRRSKKIIIVLQPRESLDVAREYLQKAENRKTVLVTSVESLEFLYEISSQLDSPRDRQSLKLRHAVETWLDSAQGVIPGTALGQFCSDLRGNLQSAESEPEVLPGVITLGWSTRRGRELARMLCERVFHGQRVEIRELSDGSWLHPLQDVPDLPHVLITYRTFVEEVTIAAISISRHLPVGLNAFQTFGKAVPVAKKRIPYLLIAPHKAVVNRTTSESTIEFASPLLYHAYLRLWDIFDSPALVIPWASDPDGHLFDDPEVPELPPLDSPTMQRVFTLVDSLTRLSGGTSVLGWAKREPLVDRIRLGMESKRLSRGISYLSQPTLKSAHYVNTLQLVEDLSKLYPDFERDPVVTTLAEKPDTILLRSKTKEVRPDPFTGVLALYDFTFCRIGPETVDRRRNLGIEFKEVVFSEARRIMLEPGQADRVAANRTAKMLFGYCDLMVFGDAVLTKQNDALWKIHTLDGTSSDLYPPR